MLLLDGGADAEVIDAVCQLHPSQLLQNHWASALCCVSFFCLSTAHRWSSKRRLCYEGMPTSKPGSWRIWHALWLQQGNTILHILASLGQTRLLKQLLKKIPSLDILGPGFGYLTPLHYATEAGHVDTVEFLLQLRADPRGVDASGWTPVHWACKRGHKPVVDLLLSYGGSIEDRDFVSIRCFVLKMYEVLEARLFEIICSLSTLSQRGTS